MYAVGHTQAMVVLLFYQPGFRAGTQFSLSFLIFIQNVQFGPQFPCLTQTKDPFALKAQE